MRSQVFGRRPMREHDNYLDEEIKTVSAQRDFRSPLESVRSMPRSKACREALHAKVVKRAFLLRLTP